MNDAPYKPRHFGPLKLLAMVLRGLAGLLSTWPLVLIAALVHENELRNDAIDTAAFAG